MRITSRFATKLAGVVILAGVVAASLSACSPAGSVDQDLLVVTNVQAVDCSTVDDPKVVTANLKATGDFVANATSKQTKDILALKGNEGQTDLTVLKATITEKTAACAVIAGVSSGELSPELKALLDASSAPLTDCVTIVTNTTPEAERSKVIVDDTYALFVKALLEVDEGNSSLRQWSDALSTALPGATAEEMRTWLNRAICEEPLIGVSLAHLFAHLEVQGVSILSLQTTDWLKPYAVDASEIDALTAQFVPREVWRLQNGKKTPPDSVYAKALVANHDYQVLASKLVFLLSRYQLASVMSINSTHHYHLVAGGLRADNIPEVEISTEVDSRPALVFYLTEKTACKPISVLAFNVGDKRPMLGAIPDTCEALVPPPPTTTTPGCVENCGGGDTPPPGCVSNCNPNPCPPGNTNPDCAPKPSDPNQYPYPDGKPPVTVTEPASPPAQVDTSVPGGGGVVDTPTNDPGSETGVQAPDTEPAPTVPTPAPSNEGGDNGAGDPGGF